MKIFTKKSGYIKNQVGFSLVQLMIALPLGLLVVAAVLKIFTGSMQGISLQNNFSRVQENGRLATELMMRDIRGADYWGCAGDIGKITNHLDTTDSLYDESMLPTAGMGIDGENDVASYEIDGITVEAGTDTLTLRGVASLPGVKVTPPYMPSTAAVIHITTGSSIVKGDILLISDCREADLFSNTQTNTATSGNIGHNTGALAGAVPNITKNLSHTYDGSAQILAPFTKIYFIGINTSNTLSLYRSDDGSAKELVRGVNDLQLTYGEDTSDNGSANLFTATPSNMANVISIKASITTESGDGSATTLERTYQTTTSIRNRTF